MLIVIPQLLDREQARALGRTIAAAEWVDGNVTSGAGAALAKLGGAKLIVSTITHGPTVVEAMGGLGVSGQMLILGAVAEPLPIATVPMIGVRPPVRASSARM